MIKKLSLLLLCFAFSHAQDSNTNKEIEYKGETLTIPVSFEQTNLIVLPSNIASKVDSKEKNLEVAINGKQAFVKFSPTIETTKLQMDAEKEAKQQKQEIKYQKGVPAELFLLADDGVTYSFILMPSQMDSQTITINNKAQKRKELSFKESQTPFKNNLDSLTKKILSEQTLSGYEVEKRNEQVASSSKIDIELKQIFRGAKLDIFLFSLINKTSIGEEVQERDLIPLLDNKSIYRIVLFYDNDVLEIPPRGTAKALVFVAADEGLKK